MPLKILYVEDEPDMRAIGGIALESVGGFTLQACDSGAAALQAAASFAPDLIILDVMMPGMDGPQTLAALRRLPITAAVPAIFLTAKTQDSDIAYLTGLGAIGVIAKPFDPMTMAGQVQALWDKNNA